VAWLMARDSYAENDASDFSAQLRDIRTKAVLTGQRR
jgi:hypothetical protein